MWRYRLGGGFLFLIAVYLFLQFSSRFFLVAWYKDGGNGATLNDAPLWMFKSAVLVSCVWALMALIPAISKVPSKLS